jgi:hypothetical protein
MLHCARQDFFGDCKISLAIEGHAVNFLHGLDA